MSKTSKKIRTKSAAGQGNIGRPMVRGDLARKRKLVLPVLKGRKADMLTKRFEVRITPELWEAVVRLHEKLGNRDIGTVVRDLITDAVISAGIAEHEKSA